MFFGRNDAKAETPVLWPPHEKTLWKRLLCWEELGAGGKGDDRGWDGWMASPTRWTCVWVNSGSWWLTERPGMLRFMESQRVGHDWATELNWTELIDGKTKVQELKYISKNFCRYPLKVGIKLIFLSYQWFWVTRDAQILFQIQCLKSWMNSSPR